jgi:hypothetical protein
MSWLKRYTPPKPTAEFVPWKQQLKYPMWTFARLAGSHKYFLLLEKTKMEFISERAFWSWGKSYVLVSEESISNYKPWKKIGFSVGTMLESQADGTQWYITGSDPLAAERRLIANPDLFDVLGFDRDELYVVSLPEVDFHKKGEDLIGVE